MESELVNWPQVTAKPMFGMVGFYRKGKIFAAVPRNRTVGQRDAVMFKLAGGPEKLVSAALDDSRTITTSLGKSGWIAFALDSGDDMRDALGWFSQAYECAGRKKQVPHLGLKPKATGGSGARK